MRLVDVMVDLETFGTGRDAAIASIGAVHFNRETGKIGAEFNQRIDLGASKHPGTFTASSVEWWLGQSDAARRAVSQGPRKPLEGALSDFSMWLLALTNEPRPEYQTRLRLWSNGPTFDEVILRDAFTRYGWQAPWHYKASRCCRTMFDLSVQTGFVPRKPTMGVKHDALDDAKAQARNLVLQMWWAKVTKCPTCLGQGRLRSDVDEFSPCVTCAEIRTDMKLEGPYPPHL